MHYFINFSHSNIAHLITLIHCHCFSVSVCTQPAFSKHRYRYRNRPILP